MVRYYLKIFLITLWFIIASTIALPFALIFWRSLHVNPIFLRTFACVGAWLAGFDLEFQYPERLRHASPCLIIMNHQSALDFMTFPRQSPVGTAVIGKKSMGWIPIFGWYFAAAGNVLIDRQNRDRAVGTLEKVRDAIKGRGMKIGIFPEGTRNPHPKKLLDFKKGAFHIAVMGGLPILPMVSSSLKTAFDPERKKFPGGKIRVRVLPMIPAVTDVSDPAAAIEKLRTEVQTLMQRTADELNHV